MYGTKLLLCTTCRTKGMDSKDSLASLCTNVAQWVSLQTQEVDAIAMDIRDEYARLLTQLDSVDQEMQLGVAFGSRVADPTIGHNPFQKHESARQRSLYPKTVPDARFPAIDLALAKRRARMESLSAMPQSSNSVHSEGVEEHLAEHKPSRSENSLPEFPELLCMQSEASSIGKWWPEPLTSLVQKGPLPQSSSPEDSSESRGFPENHERRGTSDDFGLGRSDSSSHSFEGSPRVSALALLNHALLREYLHQWRERSLGLRARLVAARASQLRGCTAYNAHLLRVAWDQLISLRMEHPHIHQPCALQPLRLPFSHLHARTRERRASRQRLAMALQRLPLLRVWPTWCALVERCTAAASTLVQVDEHASRLRCWRGFLMLVDHWMRAARWRNRLKANIHRHGGLARQHLRCMLLFDLRAVFVESGSKGMAEAYRRRRFLATCFCRWIALMSLRCPANHDE